MVSVTALQLCHGSVKAAIDSMYRIEMILFIWKWLYFTFIFGKKIFLLGIVFEVARYFLLVFKISFYCLLAFIIAIKNPEFSL